jgi:hypothetical protein
VGLDDPARCRGTRSLSKHDRMLTRAELQTLFPEADIWTERFLGLAKGFVAANIEA